MVHSCAYPRKFYLKHSTRGKIRIGREGIFNAGGKNELLGQLGKVLYSVCAPNPENEKEILAKEPREYLDWIQG